MFDLNIYLMLEERNGIMAALDRMQYLKTNVSENFMTQVKNVCTGMYKMVEHMDEAGLSVASLYSTRELLDKIKDCKNFDQYVGYADAVRGTALKLATLKITSNCLHEHFSEFHTAIQAEIDRYVDLLTYGLRCFPTDENDRVDCITNDISTMMSIALTHSGAMYAIEWLKELQQSSTPEVLMTDEGLYTVVKTFANTVKELKMPKDVYTLFSKFTGPLLECVLFRVRVPQEYIEWDKKNKEVQNAGS